MKKYLILSLVAALLFSGCLGETVKVGDKISVDYTGTLPDGTVFDTSIETVALENNLFTHDRMYQPLQFTVGKGQVVQGFDEGVVGMRVGETRTLTIPPEKGYGSINPHAIQVIPIVQNISRTRSFSKVLEIPAVQFESVFGLNHTVGEKVQIPQTNIRLTIQRIASNVSMSYDLPMGYTIVQEGAPWNETVTRIDMTNITTTAAVKVNDVIQFEDAPWNTTVMAFNAENITLHHNSIPDTVIESAFGPPIWMSFNETSVILDHNHKLAGKTMLFEVTIKSIDQ